MNRLLWCLISLCGLLVMHVRDWTYKWMLHVMHCDTSLSRWPNGSFELKPSPWGKPCIFICTISFPAGSWSGGHGLFKVTWRDVTFPFVSHTSCFWDEIFLVCLPKVGRFVSMVLVILGRLGNRDSSPMSHSTMETSISRHWDGDTPFQCKRIEQPSSVILIY